MTDWFTADWHLGHDRIIEHCKRPFTSSEQMDGTIINSVNALVMPDDRLFNLGDVAFKCSAEKLGAWRARLNCKNIFVLPGNHDKKQAIERHFTLLEKEYWYEVRDFRLVLNHYAMRVWAHSHHGAGHLYGHSHGKLSPTVTAEGLGAMAFDIGVDCWDFKPLSLSQVKEVMKYRSSTKMTGRNEIDDHHKPRS